jgi:hypothetical protein
MYFFTLGNLNIIKNCWFLTVELECTTYLKYLQAFHGPKVDLNWKSKFSTTWRFFKIQIILSKYLTSIGSILPLNFWAPW